MEHFQSSEGLTISSRSGNYHVVFEQAEENFRRNFLPGDFVIIDEIINELYPQMASIAGDRVCIVRALEISKSYKGVIPIIDTIINSGFRKNNRIIAVGGGIIQDISSFIASMLLRGVNWLFYPTNILSQCDSCIGSKVSINFEQYKNLLGGFYPPKLVVIDTGWLTTLQKQDIFSGLGEILHYCLVSSKSDFHLFEKHAPEVKKDTRNIYPLLRRSLDIKKAMIEIDEFDTGPRKIFNYGHSFGHALESALDYTVPHGIAVAFGMDLANQVSVRAGFISADERNEMRELCEMVYHDTELPPVDLQKYKSALSRDKKNVGNEVGLILTKGIGNMFFTTRPYDDIEEIISEFFCNKTYLFSL